MHVLLVPGYVSLVNRHGQMETLLSLHIFSSKHVKHTIIKPVGWISPILSQLLHRNKGFWRENGLDFWSIIKNLLLRFCEMLRWDEPLDNSRQLVDNPHLAGPLWQSAWAVCRLAGFEPGTLFLQLIMSAGNSGRKAVWLSDIKIIFSEEY